MHELQPHKLQLVVNGFKVISTKISQEEKYVEKKWRQTLKVMYCFDIILYYECSIEY